MTVQIHILRGCSPSPLANYLKALGVLRLVAEQADPDVRGHWVGESFCLLTKLERGELERFFLVDYQPTPLVAPWNKGSGFYAKKDDNLDPIEKSKARRFESFQAGIKAARKLLNDISEADSVIRAIRAVTKPGKSFQTEDQRRLLQQDLVYLGVLDKLAREADQEALETARALSQATKPLLKSVEKSAGYKAVLSAADRRFKKLKEQLIPDCRREWRGPHAAWFSAAVVLDEAGNPKYPSLLGTGGNDGRLDFTNNFMAHIAKVSDMDGQPTDAALPLLKDSLWGESTNKLASGAIGQYQPGTAGGANSSTGFADGNLINSWDFIFMLEGALVLTSRTTRRLDPIASSKASAPFAIRAHAAGYASTGAEKDGRGEQWMPIWRQPTSSEDLNALFGESRLQLHRQLVNRPIDAARAICRLGVARGIESFVRYGYLERNGQSNLAVPLGRIQVRYEPRASLIDDLEHWLSQLQRRSKDRGAPGRLAQAERRLAHSVFAALTHDSSPDRWQGVLLAAADIELLQATGAAVQAGPIPGLRPEWLNAIDDGSPELRLAVALGSAAADYSSTGRPLNPVRHHWLPLEPGARRFKASDNSVVAFGRNALSDLGAVLERRILEAGRSGTRSVPLVAARGCGALLGDLAQFLNGTLDLDKLLGLSRALMALRWERCQPTHLPRKVVDSGAVPDEPWLALRLAHLAWPLNDDRKIPADLRICRLLRSGDIPRAVKIAELRLRSAGIRPPFQSAVANKSLGNLWAAALAFPISRQSAEVAVAALDPSKKTRRGAYNANQTQR